MAEGRSANLTELALDLGFSSHSHLCGLFQKHLGMAPSQLRGGALAILPTEGRVTMNLMS
jgi:AraC-like DNA-binding protein